mmetsp:Transcript_5776/g.35875  ORF Transcript_5776/g.35875 Transcript_5776/m.35875 type:complete len:346 (-) Transcript_5776:3590-4627(-)
MQRRVTCPCRRGDPVRTRLQARRAWTHLHVCVSVCVFERVRAPPRLLAHDDDEGDDVDVDERCASIAELPPHVSAPRLVRSEDHVHVVVVRRDEIHLARRHVPTGRELLPPRSERRARGRRRCRWTTHVDAHVRESRPAAARGQAPSTILHVHDVVTSFHAQAVHVRHVPMRSDGRLDAPRTCFVLVAARHVQPHPCVGDAHVERGRDASCVAQQRRSILPKRSIDAWQAPSHVHVRRRIRRSRRVDVGAFPRTCTYVHDDAAFAQHLLPSTVEGKRRPRRHLGGRRTQSQRRAAWTNQAHVAWHRHGRRRTWTSLRGDPNRAWWMGTMSDPNTSPIIQNEGQEG